MSTNDVPGANSANQDDLCVGCWAEVDDGSYVFVKAVESGFVYYDVYSIATKKIGTHKMKDDEFFEFFSVPPVGSSDIEWVWHDKTPFPFDKVAREMGLDFNIPQDVEAQTAAETVIESLKMETKDVDPDELSKHMRVIGAKVVDAIKAGWDAFVGSK